MNTELILYKQQLASNPKFAIQPDYGWSFTGLVGMDWNKEVNKMTKLTGSTQILYQSGVLLEGVRYQVRFNVSGRTAGTFHFRNKSGGTLHVDASSNAIFDTTFVSDGTDLRFEASITFDGSVSNFSITEYPVMFNMDLTEEVGIALNFSIDNIFKVNERKTNYSNTGKLPGTHNNNIALNHLYKINAEGNFDPNKSCRVIVLNDGITAFDGILFITQVTKTVQDGISNIVYDFVMYGELTNIVDKFENKTIKDLDFSRWDHPLSLRNILVSWHSLLGGGPYSLVQGLPNVFDNSTGTYYQNQTIVLTDNGIGITAYTYLGYNRVQIEFAAPHAFSVGDYLQIESENSMISGSQTVMFIPDTTHIVLTMLYSNLANNAFTNLVVEKREWDALGYYYPMIDNGSYQRVCVNGDSAAGMVTVGRLYTVKFLSGYDDLSSIAKDPHNIANPITLRVGVTFYADDGVTSISSPIPAGTWEFGTELYTYDLRTNGAKLISKEQSPNYWHTTDFIPHIFVREVWNKMFSLIDYYYDCPLIDTTLFKRLIMPMDQGINTLDYLINPFFSPAPPTQEQMVTMNQWLPQMKLSEFFFSICNLSNLVIIEDKEQKNLIRLVSRSEFFNGDEVQLKIDSSKPLEIKLSNSFLPLGYQLKYKDGSDFYNIQYNKEFGNITNENGITNLIDRKYGDHYTPTNNKFSKEVSKVELDFTPTVLVGNNVYIDTSFTGASPYDPGNDKVISATFNADDNGLNVSRKISNRILIAGIRGTTYPWSISAAIEQNEDENFDVQNLYNGRWFPYAGHIENVLDPYPTYDLNFGTLLGQFFPNVYSITEWEAKTRYGQDWEKYLLDVTDPNGKIISGTFKMSITDIYKLDFRNIFRLDHYSLKLNKIVQWNVNGNGLCKVEFMLKNL